MSHLLSPRWSQIELAHLWRGGGGGGSSTASSFLVWCPRGWPWHPVGACLQWSVQLFVMSLCRWRHYYLDRWLWRSCLAHRYHLDWWLWRNCLVHRKVIAPPSTLLIQSNNHPCHPKMKCQKKIFSRCDRSTLGAGALPPHPLRANFRRDFFVVLVDFQAPECVGDIKNLFKSLST